MRPAVPGRRADPPCPAPGPGTGEEGQTTVLTVGLSVVCLLLATVVLAVTAVNIEARRLLSAADGAAMAAADSYRIDPGRGNAPVLTTDQAGAAVAEYLAAAGAPSRFDALAVRHVAVTDGGRTVEVVLTASAHPPVVNWIVPAGVTVTAASSSRTSLTR
ncbi:pilus assembly protein TadG-related protein [Citricoccus sp. SGAir0253]|uniref:pilus assembly protein TadG-related protein n=1 Tax=Citricoccus sp. SGAir0253 TaxID=2567881 RepID=UPI00143D6C3E|nr:pilus assembly protein TadG-related protein [Citricoccus sp. SGAir0253]